ncbi:unnamed protein product [Ranitomeya imitator]|uniref:Non-structural maintenance of chromosomes element 1 homolog n=1 Tax=Ranitomeya imitator TaxID=111125 RepID=A0ABN9KS49_9NEOB|nr:unnamed protein product [Ranitomeya imitator]
MAMSESHQRFLQVLMSHGIMEAAAVRTLHRHCCEVHKVHYMHDKLDDFVGVINKHLQPLFMHIKKGTDENNGKRYFSLVNVAENEVTNMAMDYAESELELFRKAMDLIIDSDNGFASSTNILNLADQLQSKKMKKKEVEQLLQNFVQEKWLIEKDGEYSLHTRCIMEMEHYIRSTYQDIVKTCNICPTMSPFRIVTKRFPISFHFLIPERAESKSEEREQCRSGHQIKTVIEQRNVILTEKISLVRADICAPELFFRTYLEVAATDGSNTGEYRKSSSLATSHLSISASIVYLTPFTLHCPPPV